jgi:hypothetical protein
MTFNASERKAKWVELGDKLLQLAGEIYAEADLFETNLGATDSKVVALTLLCRTVSNFRGAMMMVDQGLIVEARTLTRSCLENLIFIDALAKDGHDFVKDIVANDYKSREVRGQVLAEWAGNQNDEPPFAKKLHKFLKSIKGKSKTMINVKTIAQSGVLKDSYIIYGLLSSDAAHPSADSLSRHTQRDNADQLTIVAEGITNIDEILETEQFVCSFLLGVCVATNQILGGLPAGKKLAATFEEFNALRQEQIVPSTSG